MELGVHLPLMEFGDEGQSLARIQRCADAARECGFAALSANDHFLFATPWLDGPTALAAALPGSGDMELATSVALSVLRGPVQLAKTLAALDVLSEGRVVAGVGPGSSARDYEAVGVPWEERWKLFERSVTDLRRLLSAESELAPRPRRAVPIWIGSWGSAAGLRRVARLADGWLASAYNTTPEGFATARAALARELGERGREAAGFPNALMTMWTWVTEDRADAESKIRDVLSPLLRRDPGTLAEQLCVGPAEHCAEILSAYARAGCRRVHVWPVGDEARQIELLASDVLPRVAA